MSNNTVNKFIMPNGDVLDIVPSNEDYFLNNTQITNCLTEVPQRIKYTLEDGVLTIKAGTVAIVPYGTEDLSSTYPVGSTFLHENYKVYDTQYTESEADGNKFFVWVELQNDTTATCGNPNDRIIFISRDGTIMDSSSTLVISGPTTDSTTANIRWYDTSENIIKEYRDGSWQTNTYLSLPILVATASIDKLYTSVDKVFNSIGYIGSTLWVDKGVKGLIPNGRNEDGTLNNIEFKTECILTTTNPSNAHNNLALTVNNNYIKRLNTTLYTYDEEKNMNYDGENLEYFDRCVVVTYTRASDGRVITFQPKQPFRSVDYSDLKPCVVIIDSYVNGTSGYNVYSNGYCEQWGLCAYVASKATVSLLKTYNSIDTMNISLTDYDKNDTGGLSNSSGVASITVSSFVISTNTEADGGVFWRTTGYLAEGTY